MMFSIAILTYMYLWRLSEWQTYYVIYDASIMSCVSNYFFHILLQRVSYILFTFSWNIKVHYSYSVKYWNMLLSTAVIYWVGQNKCDHSTFSWISRKLPKIFTWFFAHVKASVYETCLLTQYLIMLFYTVAPPGESWTITTITAA